MPGNTAACYIYYRYFFETSPRRSYRAPIRHGTAFAALSFIRPLLLLIDSHSPATVVAGNKVHVGATLFSTVFIKHCVLSGKRIQ